MKRKKAVQEAVQRKINADKMRLFNNKCINSKNKAKGFWEMLRDNKANDFDESSLSQYRQNVL
jgi:hypothetical protein